MLWKFIIFWELVKAPDVLGNSSFLVCAILIRHHLHPAQIRDGGKGQQRAGESKRPQLLFGVILRNRYHAPAEGLEVNQHPTAIWKTYAPGSSGVSERFTFGIIEIQYHSTVLNKKRNPIASKKTTVIEFTNKALVLELALPLWADNAQVSVLSHAQEIKGLQGFSELPGLNGLKRRPEPCLGHKLRTSHRSLTRKLCYFARASLTVASATGYSVIWHCRDQARFFCHIIAGKLWR